LLKKGAKMTKKMTMTKVKSTKTMQQHLQDLRAGKAVKATDFCAAMGIDTFVIK
jgi:hypothetical protein